MDHIKEALKEMTSSTVVLAIKMASFHQKLFLLSSAKQARATGLAELSFGRIVEEHSRYCSTYAKPIPSMSIFNSICSYLGIYHLLTVERGKNGDPTQKVRLEVDETDIVLGIKQSSTDQMGSQMLLSIAQTF
jgi:Cdc6-like AAA superfamily ATPase